MTVRPCTSKFRFLLPPFKNAIILIYYVRRTLENREQNKGDFVTCKGYWCHLKIPNSNFPNSILHFKIQNKKHYRWETTHTETKITERDREWTEKAQKCQLWEREGHEITKSPTKTQGQMKKSTTMSSTKLQRFLSTNKREKKESKKTLKECKNLVSWTFLSSSRLALLLLKELQGQALPRRNTPLPFCHEGLFAVPLGACSMTPPPPPLFFFFFTPFCGLLN